MSDTDIVDLLGHLVAFPSESRTSNTDLIDFYADRATALGGQATVIQGEVVEREVVQGEVVEGESGANPRCNLHIRFGPDTEGGVLLSGHTDVVPAGQGWATDPYQLTGNGDRLYGRGTADMKGFLATALAVMARVETARLQRPVHLGLSYDEEVGCVGVHSLLDHLKEIDACRPDIVIIGEPTSLKLCTAHSGKRVFQVEATAPSGHSSRSTLQPTAVQAGAAIAAAVFDLNRDERAVDGFSANVGTISGGVAVNVLAPRCALDFECRHQASYDPDQLLEPVFSTIEEWRDQLRAQGGDLTVNPTVAYPALATSQQDVAVERLHAVLGRPDFGQVSFGCEAGLYADALPAPAVIFGPGDIADAHRPDESVPVSDLERAAAALSATVEQFCMEVT